MKVGKNENQSMRKSVTVKNATINRCYNYYLFIYFCGRKQVIKYYYMHESDMP